jgi:hypothetical protein
MLLTYDEIPRRHPATCDDVSVTTNDVMRTLFAYADVVDGHGPLTRHGSDLVSLPCFTPAFCSALIAATEVSGAFESAPGDPVPGNELSLARLSPLLFENLENDMGERIWPRLQEEWELIEYRGINDAFVIRYDSASGTSLRLHHDVAQVSASVKLNDDYDGGTLEFPRQNFTNADIPVGHLLAWPSLVTHPHRSAPVTRGMKYSLTIWFELPILID